MATEMSTGWLTRAIEQARAMDPAGTLGSQLHTAVRQAPAVLPIMPPFKPWGRVARPGVPGKLATYPSRVEHARAHRLAAERARRNRRCVREGRPVPGELRKTEALTLTLTFDTDGLEAAFEGIGRSLRRFGESMSTVHARLLDFHLPLLARLYAPLADETTGPDTDHCAGSGGRWSDLMARIDGLVEET